MLCSTLPRQWSLITISQDNHSFHPMFPTDHCRLVSIFPESEMALGARIYAYNRHLSFDVAFICSTLTHCGVCHLSVWRLKWEVSYVHQSVWRWKWFFSQSNYVLQRLKLCRTSDTVFRREIDSRRQWGYGTCYGGIVSPLRRSVAVLINYYLYGRVHVLHESNIVVTPGLAWITFLTTGNQSIHTLHHLLPSHSK